MKTLAFIAAVSVAWIAVKQEEWAYLLNRRRTVIIVGTTTTTTVPPVTGDLANGTWTEIPHSSMNVIYNIPPPTPPFEVPVGGWPAGIDDQWNEEGASNSFVNIQDGESSGACVGNEILVWGGGHGDGAHNGVFAIDVGAPGQVPPGTWRRVTIPASDVHASNGDGISGVQTNIDGSPASRHTYNTLASDGTNFYATGGALWWAGQPGQQPRGWKLDVAGAAADGAPMYGWSNIADPQRADSQGNLIHVDGKLYLGTPSGAAIYDIATNTWQNGFTGSTLTKVDTMVAYSSGTDRMYGVGDGLGWRKPRADWLTATKTNLPAHAVLSYKNPGLIYYPPEHRMIVWTGGPSLTTYNEDTEAWEVITPAGDPGPSGTAGGTNPLTVDVFSRFSYCGGKIVLVNGTQNNLWYIDVPDDPPPPDPVLPDPLLGEPYYGGLVASPALGDEIVETHCGSAPETWQTIDVTTDAEVAALAGTILNNYTQNLLVRLHWKATPYTTTLDANDAKCIKVLGVNGPGGERPIISRINKTRSFAPPNNVIHLGGLFVENVIAGGRSGVGPSEGISQDNTQTFFIMRNVEISQTTAHSILTAPASHMYVEIGNSYFTLTGSHLAYIDKNGMTYIYDSTFESPGMGVALRCISRRCVIDNVNACSSQCDGTIKGPGSNPFVPNRNYISNEAPLEVYACGEATVTNTRVRYRRLGTNQGGPAAIVFRKREGIRGCDVGEPNLTTRQWTVLAPTLDDTPPRVPSPEFQDPARWATVTDLNSTFDNILIECQTFPCAGISPQNTYPFWHNDDSTEFTQWRNANGPFTDWDVFSAAIQATGDQRWIWLLGQTLTGWRSNLMNGNFGDSVPYVTSSAWFNRNHVAMTNITHINPSAIGLINYPNHPNDYCQGIPPVGGTVCNERIDGRRFDTAFITVDGVPQ